VEAAQAAWGGHVHRTAIAGYGHVDLVFAKQASVDVFGPCVGWLEGLRGECWGAIEDVA
jgi:hypothetical protein